MLVVTQSILANNRLNDETFRIQIKSTGLYAGSGTTYGWRYPTALTWVAPLLLHGLDAYLGVAKMNAICFMRYDPTQVVS